MSSILMLKVSGHDRMGLTAELTTTLAEFGVILLDMGQSVIHDQVSLGMLLQLPDGADTSGVLKEILFKAHELGIHARFTPVEESAYTDWVGQQGKDRYVLTLLARRITAQQLARVSTVVSEQGLNIQDITRLTGRIPLDATADSGKACIELTLRGQPVNPDALRLAFLDISSQLDIDVAFQQDTVFRRNRRLVCFDMDSTLIETEVIDELAKAAGVGDQVAAITEQAMSGELDFQQSFRQRMALLKGLDESVLAGIAEQLPITEGAERLIRTLRAYGFKTAILSGGFTYFGHYLQQRLGIDYVYANELEIADGRVTGEVKGTIVDGARKAELLRELAQREGIQLEQTIAVGDGANDLPMLSQAGLGIAFRAKPIVRESARHAISTLGLDAVLYLLGFRDQDIH
ncbi:phosphoserine phosphatase SerB [Saccharospirillum impatiens]|uniref:phosphoserine phosphatase SerB n=1 Tax=Saccharospirillum impatiens TaxID=169438 RepID=UPI00049098BE|nr:phosphoserine phosphatase SerB [Saccharospirillum impatiens]